MGNDIEITDVNTLIKKVFKRKITVHITDKEGIIHDWGKYDRKTHT
jgi:hypothetical protein